MKAVLIDAYDSFIYIIHQYLQAAGVDTLVVRNDAATVAGIAAAAPDFVVLGPGPGHPADAGYVELIRAFRGRIPLLGVCLGHQAMGLAYGGTVAKAPQPRHGKTSIVRHDGRGVFTGLPAAYSATRYHSLIVSHLGFPPELEITATAEDDGLVMGLRDPIAAVEGVQFHPESIRTDDGMRIFVNFIRTHVDPGFAGGARRAAREPSPCPSPAPRERDRVRAYRR
jgi:anthranilate synthase component II